MKLNFCSLSSGSSGNCYYIGNEFHGFLVDAGISAGAIRKFLKGLGISVKTLMGVLVTHNHYDHTKGLDVLTRRMNIPVFTTAKIWDSIVNPPMSQKISPDCIRKIQIQQKFNLVGFEIEAFPVFHDAPETVGFHISYEGKKITIVTDLGHICETASQFIKVANLLVIESNYDEQMLLNGSYPAYLKARIKSNNGHLGNHQTSEFLAECFHDNLNHICLAHLSKNNNTPDIALQTLKQKFTEKKIALNGKQKVIVLNRNLPTEIIEI